MTKSLPLPNDAAVPTDDLSQADGALRHGLDLRPTVYKEAGGHPDRGPCPAWCSLRERRGEQHEIVADHPMEALHHIDAAIRTVASSYPGEPPRGADRIRTATVESDLTQLGSGDPAISVSLRYWEGRRQSYRKRLELTLEDAAELASTLRFLVELASE
jgi:hypothetical protein